MNVRIAATLVLLLCTSLRLPPQASAQDTAGPRSSHIRAEPAPYASVEALLNDPGRIAMTVSSRREAGRHLIESETDFHTVVPVPVTSVLSVLLDYEGQNEVYGRVRHAELLEAAEDPFGKHTVRVEVAVKVLGVGTEYAYVTDNWVRQQDDGAYTQTYELAESPDGTFYRMSGNWYIREIMYEGQRCTYVRQHTVLGIQKGSRAMELAMRTFGGMGVRQNLRELSTAADKRRERGAGPAVETPGGG